MLGARSTLDSLKIDWEKYPQANQIFYDYTIFLQCNLFYNVFKVGFQTFLIQDVCPFQLVIQLEVG